jgi:hypothetical protein
MKEDEGRKIGKTERRRNEDRKEGSKEEWKEERKVKESEGK